VPDSAGRGGPAPALFAKRVCVAAPDSQTNAGVHSRASLSGELDIYLTVTGVAILASQVGSSYSTEI